MGPFRVVLPWYHKNQPEQEYLPDVRPRLYPHYSRGDWGYYRARIRTPRRPEAEVLRKFVELRNVAGASTAAASTQAQDESKLRREMSRLFAVLENYPELKADKHFLKLQHERAHTEDRIAATRRFFNANVRDLNTLCQMFPSSLVARTFGFRPDEYFELDSDAEGAVPRVEL